VVEELRPGDPRQVGPYRLTGRLGGGGMGEVYLGRSAGGRAVAVKVIRAELAADPEFRARFRHEVAAARMVNGLYTALVADADADAPTPWLATAYVPGPSLESAITQHGPLPEYSVLALAGGLAEGIGAIHAAGLVHRDLKPSNVLLADDGPRVIDFGISRASAYTVLTSAGFAVGTPSFMSPEQAAGRQVGPPSDVFSLGSVLTFAATGEGPFGSGPTTALLFRIVNGDADLSRVPARVRPLVQRCLTKDPARRPTTADLLAELGDVQLWADWLPEQVLAGIRRAAHAQLPGGRSLRASGPLETQTVQTPPGGAKPTHPVARPPHAGTEPVAPAGGPTDAPPPGKPPGGPGRERRSGRNWRVIVGAAAAVAAVTGAILGFTLSGHGSDGTASQHTTPPASGSASGTAPAAQSAYRFAASGASEHACATGYRSAGGQRKEVHFNFTNSSRSDLQLFWLDFTGARKFYVKLQPGVSQGMDTYVGDYWLIADSAGACEGIFGVDKAGQITIAPS